MAYMIRLRICNELNIGQPLTKQLFACFATRFRRDGVLNFQTGSRFRAGVTAYGLGPGAIKEDSATRDEQPFAKSERNKPYIA